MTRHARHVPPTFRDCKQVADRTWEKMDELGVPDATGLADWRNETAPSGDGSWTLASFRDENARLAIMPPAVAPFGVPDAAASGWRAAVWLAQREDDVRGVAPAFIQPIDLIDVLDRVPAGLRPWARRAHRQAIRHERSTAQRAQAAGDAGAAQAAEERVADLERQDSEADLHAPSGN